MSNAQFVSYSDFVPQVADGVGLSVDTDVGTADTTWTVSNQYKLARCISNAVRWAYKPTNPNVFWPELMVAKTVNLVTFGSDTALSFGADDVEYNNQFGLWSEDPRPPLTQAYNLQCTQVGNRFYPNTTKLSSVFVIYAPQPPEFTNRAYDTGTVYNVDDVVMWQHNVYKCIQTTTAGILPSDPAYFTELMILRTLAQAINNKAQAYWQDMGGNQAAASSQSANDAQYELDRAWVQAQHFAPTAVMRKWINTTAYYQY